MKLKCPHCTIAINTEFEESFLRASNPEGRHWAVRHGTCPNCDAVIIFLWGHTLIPHAQGNEPLVRLVHPKGSVRLVPPEVPDPFRADYREAASVLADSPKASAAVSRRVLQDVLREEAGVTPGNLNGEIDQIIASKQLPSWLADDLDAVRTVGNFAAHPTKSTNSGEVVPVEAGEAEWLLNVLDGLFDFYFVEPAKAELRRTALNEKLEAAGKPPLKASG